VYNLEGVSVTPIDHILKEFMSMIYVATMTASYIQIRVRTIISTITFILLSLKNNTKELLHGVTETPSKLYTVAFNVNTQSSISVTYYQVINVLNYDPDSFVQILEDHNGFTVFL
jgi:hypothetical protein